MVSSCLFGADHLREGRQQTSAASGCASAHSLLHIDASFANDAGDISGIGGGGTGDGHGEVATSPVTGTAVPSDCSMCVCDVCVAHCRGRARCSGQRSVHGRGWRNATLLGQGG